MTPSSTDQAWAHGRDARGAVAANVGAFRRATGRATEPDAARAAEVFTVDELRQLHALADGAGVPAGPLVAYNLLGPYASSEGCSVAAAVGAASASGGTVFAKNSDKQGDESLVGERYAHFREINVVTDFVSPSGVRVLGVCAAGTLGLKMGVSSAGVAGGTNYAHTREVRRRAVADDVTLHDHLAQDRAMLLRRALDRPTALDAARWTLGELTEHPMATPGNLEFTAADVAFVVEGAYAEASVTQVRDDVMVRTNRFELLDKLNDDHESSRLRYEWLDGMLRPRSGAVTPELLVDALTSHVNGPGSNSVCVHGAGLASRTLASMVVQLSATAAPEVRVALGTPCLTWPRPDQVLRTTLTPDAPAPGERFRDGSVWLANYRDEQPQPAAP